MCKLTHLPGAFFAKQRLQIGYCDRTPQFTTYLSNARSEYCQSTTHHQHFPYKWIQVHCARIKPMAVTLQLIGLSIKQLKSIFGCKDQKVAKQLTELYEEQFGANYYREDEKERHRSELKLINNIVMGKITPQAAEENPNFPFLLINIFVWFNQELIVADGDNWSGFIDYLTETERKLNGKAEEIEIAFFSGRALFTTHKNLPYQEFPYGYFKNNEIKEMLEYMNKHKDVFYDLEGWGNIFPQFLTNIEKADKDLFHCAS